MEFKIKRRLYEALPGSIKTVVGIIPFSVWGGYAYREVFDRGELFDRATRQEILSYQEQELAKVLRFAVDNVPAYHHLSRVVDRYAPLDALLEFPLLDKENLQRNWNLYLPKCIDNIPHYESGTGGTTGNPLRILLDNNSQSVEMGFLHRQWQRVGYSPKYRKATFRGVNFSGRRTGIFWQINPIYNECQFSPFQMSENNLKSYVDQLVSFKPRFLHGYPSAIDVLAEYILRSKLVDCLPPIKAVFIGSEGATRAQREQIGDAFRARVFAFYGHSERVVIAAECEMTDTYHHMPDYGLLEIVDDGSKRCCDEGQRGEIVGTGFYNRCMPLIRYRSGDYATRLTPSCTCGRHWDRFCELEGRWEQTFLVGKNGARISIAALNMHGPLFSRIVQYQYRQTVEGKCVFFVKVAPGFTENDRSAIEKAYNEKVGGEIDFVVETTTHIPLTPRGKFLPLVSEIAPYTKSQRG